MWIVVLMLKGARYFSINGLCKMKVAAGVLSFRVNFCTRPYYALLEISHNCCWFAIVDAVLFSCSCDCLKNCYVLSFLFGCQKGINERHGINFSLVDGRQIPDDRSQYGKNLREYCRRCLRSVVKLIKCQI